jgi:hypothetical protein
VDAAYKAIDSLVRVDAELLDYSVNSVTEGINALATTRVIIKPAGGCWRRAPPAARRARRGAAACLPGCVAALLTRGRPRRRLSARRQDGQRGVHPEPRQRHEATEFLGWDERAGAGRGGGRLGAVMHAWEGGTSPLLSPAAPAP